jgi:hypothetical protein
MSCISSLAGIAFKPSASSRSDRSAAAADLRSLLDTAQALLQRMGFA